MYKLLILALFATACTEELAPPPMHVEVRLWNSWYSFHPMVPCTEMPTNLTSVVDGHTWRFLRLSCDDVAIFALHEDADITRTLDVWDADAERLIERADLEYGSDLQVIVIDLNHKFQ